MSIYFTSDTHFGHDSIRGYVGRSFPDLHTMNKEMTSRWNSRVLPWDTIFHLGDFALGQKSALPVYLSKLNGYKILIKGNHDRSISAMLEAGFDEAYTKMNVEVDGIKLYLHHQPMIEKYWKGADLMLCGHIHDLWKRAEPEQRGFYQFRPDKNGRIINVGVDQWDFYPQTLQELISG